MSDNPNSELLKISLSAAVPLWIEQIRSWPEDRRLERAKVCGQVVAEKGDIIQFKEQEEGRDCGGVQQACRGDRDHGLSSWWGDVHGHALRGQQ